jgi:hypothetical protein
MEANVTSKGFWGWVKRNVHIISAVAVVVGLGPIALALEAAVYADGGPSSGKGSGDYEPTASESAILDPWVTLKLTPFYQQLLMQAKSAFDSNDYNYQLETINKVVMKMCVVKEYYKTRDSLGLSPSALALRNALIEEIFLPVEEMIANSIKNTANLSMVKYPVSVGNNNEFLPLDIKNFTASCEKYSVAGNQDQNANTGSLLTTSPVVINPVNNQVISDPIKTTTEKQGSKSNIALILLGLIGIAILLYPDDEDKKNEKKSKKQSESEE